MFLSAYSGLIKHLPYRDQAFETRKETWDRDEYQKHEEFVLFLNKSFSHRNMARFSRQDLFDKVSEDIKGAVFSIILWGYPRNMRGNTFKSILSALPEIEKVLSGPRELDAAGFAQICRALKGKGIGLSTLTKFLYFFEFTLDGYRCLILDSRIMDVFNSKTFHELNLKEAITEYNKEKYYIDYLRLMTDAANKNRCSVDQLELFLFQFGRNLKAALI